MKFNEDSRVKIPAILHLMRLGYNYLSLKSSKWDPTTNIFRSIFDESISRINLNHSELDLKTFNEIINPQFEKNNLIQKENQELSSLRDWLLPMLMNGQVTIKEAEERVSMAAEPEERYGRD